MLGHNWRPNSVHFLAKVGPKSPRKIKKKRYKMLTAKVNQIKKLSVKKLKF